MYFYGLAWDTGHYSIVGLWVICKAVTSGCQDSLRTNYISENTKSRVAINCKQHFHHLIMAPNTRAEDRFTPPPGPEKGFPATTRKRTRFFNAYDRDHATKSFRQLCVDEDVGESTGRYWLRQRRNLGHLAIRRTRKLSDKLGMKSKVTKTICKMLVDPKQNPIRDQLYEAQLTFHDLPVQKRQLQRKLKEYTHNARRYKMAFVNKQVSAKNKEERVAYREEHKDDTINEYWSHVVFTDEAHVDPKS